MTETRSRPPSLAAVGRSTMVLTGAAVIVQVIGFARQLFLAAEVGITSGLDAFLIALAAPLALVGILTAGVQVAIVPAYAEAKDERGPTDARRLVGTVLVWTAAAGAAISLALFVLAEAIVAITGPGLAEAGTAHEAVRYLRALAPLSLLVAISSVFSAACQAESRFSAIAVAHVAGPLITVVIMVHYWDTKGLDGLVLGTLVGTSTSLGIIVLYAVMQRLAPLPRLTAPGLGLRKLVRHAAPLSASAAILEINFTFDRAIASWLAEGGVSALRYGESIVRTPFAAISPAWSQALYPALVQANRDPTQSGLADMTERTLRYALVFFVPLAWLTLAVSPVAVGTAYDRGSFTGADLVLTAGVVAASAPLIVTWVVGPMLVSALNARRMGMVMMVASILNVVLNTLLNVLFGLLFGVIGVALATTIVSVIVVGFFLHRFARAEPTFSPRALGKTFGKASIAILPSALVFGVPIWAGLIEGDLLQRVVLLVVVGVTGLSSYYAMARYLRLDEAVALVTFGKVILSESTARLRLRN